MIIAANLLVAAGEGNLLVAAGEGTFGVLVLTGRPALRQMIMLETVSGTGAAIFYPASQALLPVLAPGDLLRSMMATPVGALVAGPAATVFTVRGTQYGAAALIAVVSALSLIPRDIRRAKASGAGAVPGTAAVPDSESVAVT